MPLNIHPDIAQAHTPPAAFYTDPAMFDLLRERVLARSWHWVGDEHAHAPSTLAPFTLLPGCLDEPLLWATDRDGHTRCLSNVCTHRGTVLVEAAGAAGPSLRCRYHGRRFGLDGRFESMPEFEGCHHFPSESDNLAQVATHTWRGHKLVGLKPAHSANDVFDAMESRIGWLQPETWKHDHAHSHAVVWAGTLHGGSQGTR